MDLIGRAKVLSHLDISHNQLTVDDVQALSRSVLQCGTPLVGLHLEGNHCHLGCGGVVLPSDPSPVGENSGVGGVGGVGGVDGGGVPGDNVGGGGEKGEASVSLTMPHHKMLSSDASAYRAVGFLGGGTYPHRPHFAQHSACWLCGGWSAASFSWSPGTSDYAEQHDSMKVDILFSIDGWTPVAMARSEDGSFRFHRMVPPGTTEYLFRVDGVLRCASDQPWTHLYMSVTEDVVAADTAEEEGGDGGESKQEAPNSNAATNNVITPSLSTSAAVDGSDIVLSSDTSDTATATAATTTTVACDGLQAVNVFDVPPRAAESTITPGVWPPLFAVDALDASVAVSSPMEGTPGCGAISPGGVRGGSVAVSPEAFKAPRSTVETLNDATWIFDNHRVLAEGYSAPFLWAALRFDLSHSKSMARAAATSTAFGGASGDVNGDTIGDVNDDANNDADDDANGDVNGDANGDVNGGANGELQNVQGGHSGQSVPVDHQHQMDDDEYWEYGDAYFIREVMTKDYDALLDIYAFYASATGSHPFGLHLNAFTDLCVDSKIIGFCGLTEEILDQIYEIVLNGRRVNTGSGSKCSGSGGGRERPPTSLDPGLTRSEFIETLLLMSSFTSAFQAANSKEQRGEELHRLHLLSHGKRSHREVRGEHQDETLLGKKIAAPFNFNTGKNRYGERRG